MFEFSGDIGLKPIDGGKGRGRHVFYSPVDYIVREADERQKFRGSSEDYGTEKKT